MIIITVIFILALSLSGMAISTRMQFNKTDQHNKATDLAEMGITYFQTAINSLIQPAEDAAQDAAKNDLNTTFCTELIKQIDLKRNDQTSYKTVEGSNGYQIISPTIDCTDGSKVVIDFNSKGKADKEEVNIKGKFTILKGTTNSRVGESIPNFLQFSKIMPGTYTLKNDNGKNNGEDGDEDEYIQNSYDSSISFLGSLTVQGKTSFNVNNDAYFSNLTLRGDGTEDDSVNIKGDGIFSSLYMNGHTILNIDGDAIFLVPKWIYITQKPTICVKGNIYKVDFSNLLNPKLIDFTDYENYFTNVCENSGWSTIDDNGIKIEY